MSCRKGSRCRVAALRLGEVVGSRSKGSYMGKWKGGERPPQSRVAVLMIREQHLPSQRTSGHQRAGCATDVISSVS